MKSKIVTFAMLALASAHTFAGDSPREGPIAVPELDGGMAFIAVALTAGIVALIRERRSKQ